MKRRTERSRDSKPSDMRPSNWRSAAESFFDDSGNLVEIRQRSRLDDPGDLSVLLVSRRRGLNELEQNLLVRFGILIVDSTGSSLLDSRRFGTLLRLDDGWLVTGVSDLGAGWERTEESTSLSEFRVLFSRDGDCRSHDRSSVSTSTTSSLSSHVKVSDCERSRGKGTNRKFCGGGESSSLGTKDLDNVLHVGILDVVGVGDRRGRLVLFPSWENDLDAVLSLQLLQMNGSLTDDRGVKVVGYRDGEDDSRLEIGDFGGESFSDLLDQSFRSANRNGIDRFVLLGESNSVGRCSYVARSTSSSNELSN